MASAIITKRTEYTAYIQIRNNLELPIYNLTVAHVVRMQPVYKKTWSQLAPSKLSSKKEVNFETVSVFDDKWQIEFVSQDQRMLCFSKPVEVDVLSQKAAFLSYQAKRFRATTECAGDYSARIDACRQLLSMTDLKCHNTLEVPIMDYSSLHTHNLKEEDAGKVTKIELNKDGSVRFISESDLSETSFACLSVSPAGKSFHVKDGAQLEGC
ncbi:hypothetical protein QQS21_002817 [Conoideocrella luteorostrata]|uniref:Up-regulated in Daf-2 domain-containing protein n=1 Tax=Conoideocrella luteorostrata TaxID=1105319 RepID=A0AAJ0CUB3_9HYPO|nr:hypothetical protein QQS21_002817 [Conoideocrella luteorostrata]